MRGFDRKWQAHDCSETHPFICQQEAEEVASWRNRTQIEPNSTLPPPQNVFPLTGDSLGVDVVGNGEYALLNAVVWSAYDDVSSGGDVIGRNVASIVDVPESYIVVGVDPPLSASSSFTLTLNFRLPSLQPITILSSILNQSAVFEPPTFELYLDFNDTQPWFYIGTTNEMFGAPVNITSGGKEAKSPVILHFSTRTI